MAQTLEDKLDAMLTDSINHPAHYTYGSIEVIDVIEGLRLPYHLGNAVWSSCASSSAAPPR